MRIQIKKDGTIVIRLKEEDAPYYDEYFNQERSQIAYGKHKAIILPYYSERGELAEIEIYRSTLRGEDSDFYPEVEVPEKLPWRTYVFTFYHVFGDIKKTCADSYNDLYDTDERFFSSSGLIVERRDGGEMRPSEIMSLREDFYKDALEWFTQAGAFYDWGIDSVYFNRKLFFWEVDERFYPHTLKEFKRNMFEMIRLIYGEPDHVTEERRIDEIFEGEIAFDFLVEDTHLIVCLANEESFTDVLKELSYRNVVEICERLIEDSYEKQTFVFHDVLPEREEREKLREWARGRALR